MMGKREKSVAPRQWTLKLTLGAGLGVLAFGLIWWLSPVSPVVQQAEAPEVTNINILPVPDFTGYKSTTMPKRLAGSYQPSNQLLQPVSNSSVSVKKLNTALRSMAGNYKRHPQAATIMIELGTVWAERGRINKALQYYIKARDIRIVNFGRNDLRVAEVWEYMAKTWSRKKAYEYATKYYELALNVYQQEYDEDHLKIAKLQEHLGIAWMRRHEYRTAITYFTRSLVIYNKRLRSSHPGIISLQTRLGIAWAELKQYRKAVRYLQQSYDLRSKILGKKHPVTIETAKSLRSVQAKLK